MFHSGPQLVVIKNRKRRTGKSLSLCPEAWKGKLEWRGEGGRKEQGESTRGSPPLPHLAKACPHACSPQWLSMGLPQYMKKCVGECGWWWHIAISVGVTENGWGSIFVPLCSCMHMCYTGSQGCERKWMRAYMYLCVWGWPAGMCVWREKEGVEYIDICTGTHGCERECTKGRICTDVCLCGCYVNVWVGGRAVYSWMWVYERWGEQLGMCRSGYLYRWRGGYMYMWAHGQHKGICVWKSNA